tara:strand:+ start:556 stop:873 length:318 start_codon:yes stop_codon:yes gene_type:complete
MFKPTKKTIIFTIILSLILFILLYFIPNFGGCCNGLKSCSKEEISIRVPPAFPGSYCCHICGSRLTKFILEDIYSNILAFFITLLVLNYILVSIIYHIKRSKELK